MASSYPSTDVLPLMAKILVLGSGAATARVWLRVGEELVPAATWPDDTSVELAPAPLHGFVLPPLPDAHYQLAVRHRGELIGAITVTQLPRSTLSPVDLRLLDDFASQAGLVLRNVRLTAELANSLEAISAQATEIRASRRRIVDTQADERRRVERDIHDGAQQYLVALMVKLRVARTLARRDPPRARGMVEDLRHIVTEALETLGDLAQGIHPPVLTAHGLGVALRRQEANPAVRVSVEDDGLGRYPIEVEAAVYFVPRSTEQRGETRTGIERRRPTRRASRSAHVLRARRRIRLRPRGVPARIGPRQHGRSRRRPRRRARHHVGTQPRHDGGGPRPAADERRERTVNRPNVRLGSVLFYIFFVPYTIGVVVFLIAGLSPSIAKEFHGVHDALHEFAGDALLANNEVSMHFENFDTNAHRIAILGPSDEPAAFASPLVPPHGRRTFRFRAPVAGSYSLVAQDKPGGHIHFQQEIRFAEHGGRSIALRVPSEKQQRFERLDERGWKGVAGRVAAAAHHADHGGRVLLESAFSVLNLGLGLLLIARRPRDRTARLLAVAMIGTGAMFNHQSHSTVTDYLIGDWGEAHNLFHLVSALAFLFAVVVFPDGRLLPLRSRHRGLLRLGYGLVTLVLAAIVLNDTQTGHPGQPFFTQPFFTVLFGLLIPLAGIGAQTYRLRRATDPVVQQQSRLLRWVLVPMFFVGIIYLVLTRAFEKNDVVTNIGLAVFPALFALVPLALVMGILRYRLWDIDILVSRTLMSVGLAAFIGLVYVVVVLLFGMVLLGRGLGSGGFLADRRARDRRDRVRARTRTPRAFRQPSGIRPTGDALRSDGRVQ